jgi:GNAT superfamily N-acetyltransferase
VPCSKGIAYHAQMTAKMKERVTTWHVEMTAPAELKPAGAPRTPYQLDRARVPVPELSRFLYASVGAEWRWYERLEWSYARWSAHLNRPEVGTWIASVAGTPAGYFELERQPPAAVEIAYFGLLPQFIGQGIGGALLTDAVRAAWSFLREDEAESPASTDARIWLHTCTLDHPAALQNYQARGFKLFDTVAALEEVPIGPLDPWPGAGKVDGR